MTEQELKDRTRMFSIEILQLVDTLPHNRSASIISHQLGRSASSVAANYRAACRSRSHSEFISKIAIVEEEADESCFWLSIIPETQTGFREKVEPLLKEAKQLTAIFTASTKTAKSNRSK